MAGDRLLPVYLSIEVGLLDATLQNAFFVVRCIGAFFAINDGCTEIAVLVNDMFALLFDGLDALGREIWFHRRIYVFQDLKFIRLKRCPGIPLHTTSSLALLKVTDELLVADIIRY